MVLLLVLATTAPSLSSANGSLIRRASAEDALYFQPAIYEGRSYRVREGWLTEGFAKSAMLAEQIRGRSATDDLRQAARSGYLDFREEAAVDDYPRCYVLPQKLRDGNDRFDPIECKLTSGSRKGSIIWATWITVRND